MHAHGFGVTFQILRRVLADRAVRRERAHAGDVGDRASAPMRRARGTARRRAAAPRCRRVVGQQQVVVAAPQQRVDQAAVACRARRARTRRRQSHRAPPSAAGCSRRCAAAGSRSRAAAEPRACVRPKMKMLSSPTCCADLDVGAVVGADGQRAVQRELHVAGARGLGAGGGDLLRQIGARHDHLGHRDAVVRHEHHLQPVVEPRVVR